MRAWSQSIQKSASGRMLAQLSLTTLRLRGLTAGTQCTRCVSMASDEFQAGAHRPFSPHSTKHRQCALETRLGRVAFLAVGARCQGSLTCASHAQQQLSWSPTRFILLSHFSLGLAQQKVHGYLSPHCVQSYAGRCRHLDVSRVWGATQPQNAQRTRRLSRRNVAYSSCPTLLSLDSD